LEPGHNAGLLFFRQLLLATAIARKGLAFY